MGLRARGIRTRGRSDTARNSTRGNTQGFQSLVWVEWDIIRQIRMGWAKLGQGNGHGAGRGMLVRLQYSWGSYSLLVLIKYPFLVWVFRRFPLGINEGRRKEGSPRSSRDAPFPYTLGQWRGRAGGGLSLRLTYWSCSSLCKDFAFLVLGENGGWPGKRLGRVEWAGSLAIPRSCSLVFVSSSRFTTYSENYSNSI